jgi:hypothetical protein
MTFRVTNWRDYEAGLRRRGRLTFWVDEAAIAGWRAAPCTTPGGQARYSALDIETRDLPAQQAEAIVGVTALNRRLDVGRPNSVRVA